MRPDIEVVRALLSAVRVDYPDVKIKYAGAETAAVSLLGFEDKALLKLALHTEKFPHRRDARGRGFWVAAFPCH